MRTSVPNVWAAGDACSIQWPDRPPSWFQMRLWTQVHARHAHACDLASMLVGARPAVYPPQADILHIMLSSWEFTLVCVCAGALCICHCQLTSCMLRVSMQARLTGLYTAHTMAGNPEEAAFAFNFELFTHATRFLGKRVILLGLYNGQGLDDEPDNDIVTYSKTTEVRPRAHRHACNACWLTCHTAMIGVEHSCYLQGRLSYANTRAIGYNCRSYKLPVITDLHETSILVADQSNRMCMLVQGPDATFVRVLLLRSKLMGAVLIGNTDYEEVFENLILDGLDLSSFGPDLLSSDIDLDQMFD